MNTKSIKLGISPDDTKFKHIYENITYTYIINDTYNLEPETHYQGSLKTKDKAVVFL